MFFNQNIFPTFFVSPLRIVGICMTKNDYLKAGLGHFSTRNYALAITAFKSALEIDPDFDLAINALAEVYSKSGLLDNALPLARKLVELNPEDPLAHAALSRIYMQMGMIPEAEKELAISNRLAQNS